MPYTTQAELESRFGQMEIIQLTDRSNLGVVDSVVLDRAINDAQAVADGYLRGAYSLPLASIPAELTRVCSDLTRFFLYDNQSLPIVQQRRDEAISWLRDVAAGRVSLGLDVAGQLAVAPVGSVKYSANARVFDDTTLAGY